ncbi:high affinity cAMP-specific and IBMX-insensitive 3-cyclic phosphodiesterase 8A [Crotalus adamanteus]|uniref:High affinity cAMP-specific and IBMX-insensitive 3-cyclic phosphodiesterase 8A n=1 Tax=Crotalus adamanteus TaxID=8729 RepID=A0AAW1AWR0_CROAD
MGCAPSIHISDSRVVYHSNKDPEDSNSSQQGNPVPGLFIKSSNTTSYKLRTNLTKKDSRDNMEAESRTKRSSVKNGGNWPLDYGVLIKEAGRYAYGVCKMFQD